MPRKTKVKPCCSNCEHGHDCESHNHNNNHEDEIKKTEEEPIEREVPNINIVYNSIEELIEYYNKCCKPIDGLKKTNGEVFTPLKIVNEMLNHTPIEVWSNPNLKWFDPSAGIGNFPFVVYLRLMIGLKDVILDEEARRKHILEEMIYMCEYNSKNVNILKQLFYGE